MTPEQEQKLYLLQRQAAELNLRTARLHLETAQAEHRAATETLYPQAGRSVTPAGYETKQYRP